MYCSRPGTIKALNNNNNNTTPIIIIVIIIIIIKIKIIEIIFERPHLEDNYTLRVFLVLLYLPSYEAVEGYLRFQQSFLNFTPLLETLALGIRFILHTLNFFLFLTT